MTNNKEMPRFIKWPVLAILVLLGLFALVALFPIPGLEQVHVLARLLIGIVIYAFLLKEPFPLGF